MEIPIFERCITRETVYDLKPLFFSRYAVLIPVNVLGGIQIGLGVNKDLKLLFSLSYSTGLHPLVK